MKYKLVIFDFDGTLADSFPWFIKTMNVVTEKFNLKRINEEEISELRKLDSLNFLKHLNVPLYKLPRISTYMRSLMTKNINEIKLMPGMQNLLQTLKERGYKLAVVSTNSETNIVKVLGEELFSVFDHFVAGVSLFGKESKLKKVLKLSGIDKKDAIYLGDELRDIQASKKVGLSCGSVTWGVNDAEALAALNPEEIFYEVEEILKRV